MKIGLSLRAQAGHLSQPVDLLAYHVRALDRPAEDSYETLPAVLVKTERPPSLFREGRNARFDLRKPGCDDLGGGGRLLVGVIRVAFNKDKQVPFAKNDA